jgi:DNA invertase Pin-like site-specific DNA recombinase
MNAEPSSLDFALPEKIQTRHNDRQAIVYVRQSTVRQVEHNRESTRLQYALADRACRLGWRRDQITVIDDDLGRSGASTLDRPGFQRLVAEVGLGHVGMVIGIEVSRLARSCRDWHQLLEMGALFDTLIGDADGVYDPSTYNDRLLLGLKGTMSEAELHILKSRMHEGRKAKARRGELILGLPRGYVLKPSGEVALDPDEEVQRIVRLVFALFEKRRSISGVLRYLVDHDIELPDRVRSGPEKGDVYWSRPNNATIGDMLRHPSYAGAYVYGRSRSDGRLRLPGKPHSGRRIIRDPQKWMVLHQNALPAYIDWKTYERNQEQMAANRMRYPGVPRGGTALLGGLVSCGVCGRKMVTTYNDDGREARYSCSWEATTYGGRHCQSISARPVDACVSALVLDAISPSALDVSLQVAEDIELERQQIHDGWKQRLERADYEIALARRRYEAVDPDNRLVARTLERDWEAALARKQTLADDHQKTLSRQPEQLTDEEKQSILRLAEDLPSLWKAQTTTARDRQTIARILLDRVVIQVFGETERAEIKCHWAGGIITTHPIIRTVRRFEQLEHYDEILARIAALRAQGATARQIADDLNAQGWSPAKKSKFDALIVQKLLVRKGLGKKRPIWSNHVPRRNDDEVTLQELSERLGVHRQTAYGWLRRGKLKGHIVEVGTQRIWLVSLSHASTGTCTGESS